LRTGRTADGRMERVALGLALIAGFVRAQDSGDQELARRIADAKTRWAAIDAVSKDKIPVLLEWTRTPPDGVDEFELRVGLIEALGKLKVKEAIPFLIQNINLRPSLVSIAPWLKVAEAVENTFPAIAALINIGPDSSAAVISAYKESLTGRERRLAAVFVVSRIKDAPEADQFLMSVILDSPSRDERLRAAEGLKYLCEKSK
jgi:HEAT repeat protein